MAKTKWVGLQWPYAVDRRPYPQIYDIEKALGHTLSIARVLNRQQPTNLTMDRGRPGARPRGLCTAPSQLLSLMGRGLPPMLNCGKALAALAQALSTSATAEIKG